MWAPRVSTPPVINHLVSILNPSPRLLPCRYAVHEFSRQSMNQIWSILLVVTSVTPPSDMISFIVVTGSWYFLILYCNMRQQWPYSVLQRLEVCTQGSLEGKWNLVPVSCKTRLQRRPKRTYIPFTQSLMPLSGTYENLVTDNYNSSQRYCHGWCHALNPLKSTLAFLQVPDRLHTLDLEISFIWKSEWNLIKALYLLTRYVPFIDSIIILCIFSILTVNQVRLYWLRHFKCCAFPGSPQDPRRIILCNAFFPCTPSVDWGDTTVGMTLVENSRTASPPSAPTIWTFFLCAVCVTCLVYTFYDGDWSSLMEFGCFQSTCTAIATRSYFLTIWDVVQILHDCHRSPFDQPLPDHGNSPDSSRSKHVLLLLAHGTAGTLGLRFDHSYYSDSHTSACSSQCHGRSKQLKWQCNLD